MTKYIFTSSKLTGSATFEYDSNGLLTAFKHEFESFTLEQLIYLLKHALTEADLLAIAKASKTVKASKVKQEVSFEMFYDAYGHKKDKASAAKAWSRLSKADQLLAFDHIASYDNDLIRNPRAKLYPSTYLNKKPWLD